MLERARRVLEEAGVETTDRFDVPGKGSGEGGEARLRPDVERLVPALQSASLFGGRTGVLVVDAQNLLKAEAEAIADLASSIDPETVTAVFVSAGAFPAPLSKTVRAEAQVHAVKALRDRDAAGLLVQMARERRIRLEPAASTALLQRFGTDIAALGQALDQLASVSGPVTVDVVTERFRNRPDEPLWHYVDALAAGDAGTALRRLSDFLTHGHPLALLATVETDLKRRALATSAPSQEVLEEWLGAPRNHYPVAKAWRARGTVSDGDVHDALQAVARADIALKSAPEATHRVTMERLTVALARWYGGR